MKKRSALLAILLTLGLAACGGNATTPPSDGTETGQSGTGTDQPAAPDTGGDKPTIVVGSQAYYSNEIIAELYAQVLENAGYTVDRQYQIGSREVYLPELIDGVIDLLPEYSGNLLQYLDSEATARTPADIAATIASALPDGLRPLEVAAATDQDSYTVTAEFAAEHNLTTIADLAKVDVPLTIGANSEFEIRPYGPAGALETYGVTIAVYPIEDYGGPLTVKALLDGTVNVADIYTASPSIAENNLVTLEDPENLILPQNVLPIASDKVDDEAAKLINEVTVRLDTAALIEMNRLSTAEQQSSAKIATDWLTEQGLLK